MSACGGSLRDCHGHGVGGHVRSEALCGSSSRATNGDTRLQVPGAPLGKALEEDNMLRIERQQKRFTRLDQPKLADVSITERYANVLRRTRTSH
jgi:hypothetical protein